MMRWLEAGLGAVGRWIGAHLVFCGAVFIVLVVVFTMPRAHAAKAVKGSRAPIVGAYKLAPGAVMPARRAGTRGDASGFCLKHPKYCKGGRARVVK